MTAVVNIRGLAKRYRIGDKASYRTLRETVVDAIRAPLRLAGAQGGAKRGPENDEIWALRGVSFEVARGEVLGIVGPNGAGKSTLLKILSRVTPPTSGRAEIYGRVRSLLEVGTGFHPELTGSENVYLNGAVLGMKRREIDRKFDEIVAFAGVERFIDTPVKHYSDGMRVRLAFAVAAHLEPEILLVDEVLAVGDAAFWQKSTDKMRELNERGMTILLVTHNMWLVQTVCSQAVLLDRGLIAASGSPQSVIEAYRGAVEARDVAQVGHEFNGAQIHVVRMEPVGEWISQQLASPYAGLRLEVSAQVTGHHRVKFFVRVTSPDDFAYFSVYSELLEVPGSGRLGCEVLVPHLMLKSGDYVVWTGICSAREREEILAETYFPLAVKDADLVSTGKGTFWNRSEWKVRPLG